MLKRFEQQKAIFVKGLKCLGYVVSFEDDYCAILSNDTNWDIELAGDPRDDFFFTSLVNRKHQKKYSLETLMGVYLKRDAAEGILYCTLNVTKHDIYEHSKSQLKFILDNKKSLFDDQMKYDEKYQRLNVVPWWACLDGVPPDLSFLYE